MQNISSFLLLNFLLFPCLFLWAEKESGREEKEGKENVKKGNRRKRMREENEGRE
jgi:hypothetical protein